MIQLGSFTQRLRTYSVMELNDLISHLGDLSSESNLALNEAKAKWMLVSTHQMSRAQSLNNYYSAVSCSGKLLEHVTTAKILGVNMDEHLTWADHVTVLLSSCYAALAVFPCSQAVSGITRDVKTGLQVHLSSIPFQNTK